MSPLGHLASLRQAGQVEQVPQPLVFGWARQIGYDVWGKKKMKESLSRLLKAAERLQFLMARMSLRRLIDFLVVSYLDLSVYLLYV